MSMVLRAADAPVASRVDYWRHVVHETLGPLEVRMPPAAGDQLRVADAGAVRVAELTAGRPVGPAARPSRSAGSTSRCARSTCWSAGAGWWPRTAGRRCWHRATSPWSTCHARPTGPCRRCGWSRWCSRGHCCRCAPTRSPSCPRSGSRAARAPARWSPRSPASWCGACATGARATGPGSAATWSPSPWPPGWTGPPSCRRRPGSRPCGSASTPRGGPARRGCRRPRSPPPTTSRSVPVQAVRGRGDQRGRRVRQRRLERCRRDLLDPASAARPVSVVAARWGLVNAAHFSRAFRAAYGLSPVEYRAMAGGGSGPR